VFVWEVGLDLSTAAVRALVHWLYGAKLPSALLLLGPAIAGRDTRGAVDDAACVLMELCFAAEELLLPQLKHDAAAALAGDHFDAAAAAARPAACARRRFADFSEHRGQGGAVEYWDFEDAANFGFVNACGQPFRVSHGRTAPVAASWCTNHGFRNKFEGDPFARATPRPPLLGHNSNSLLGPRTAAHALRLAVALGLPALRAAAGRVVVERLEEVREALESDASEETHGGGGAESARAELPLSELVEMALTPLPP
jgi:hypothetical protein